MPNLNGIGPQGLGPRTGGGRGWCNPSGLLRMGRRIPYLSPRRILGFGRGRSPRGSRRGFFGRGRGIVGRRRRW